MRLAILSALHLTVAGMPVPQVACDVVILAGDVARPQQAMAWAKQFTVLVIYVPGNHEYYGGSLSGTLSTLRELARGSQVHVLERDELRLGGVRFLGCTLWTDFRLQATEAERRGIGFSDHREQAETVAGIHRERPLHQVGARIVDGPQPAVADELAPGWFVHQFENEGGVSERQRTQAQA